MDKIIYNEEIVEKNHKYLIRHVERDNKLFVIVCSVNLQIGDYAAYVKNVIDMIDISRWRDVAERGEKLIYSYTKLLFPDIDAKYRWRS